MILFLHLLNKYFNTQQTICVTGLLSHCVSSYWFSISSMYLNNIHYPVCTKSCFFKDIWSHVHKKYFIYRVNLFQCKWFMDHRYLQWTCYEEALSVHCSWHFYGLLARVRVNSINSNSRSNSLQFLFSIAIQCLSIPFLSFQFHL